MKKFGLLLLTLVLIMQFEVCYALGIEYDIIPKVEVSDLKTPYNYTGILDTDVELTKESRSVVNKVEWFRKWNICGYNYSKTWCRRKI